MSRSFPSFSVVIVKSRSPPNLSLPTTPAAPSPTETWSWPQPLYNLTFWHRRSIYARTQSTTSPTTLSLSNVRKGGALTSVNVAYLLLIHALRQLHHHYLPLHALIPGMANVISDQCSHHFQLTDSQPIAHFNSSLPHTMPWRVFHLRKENLYALILALSRKRPNLGSLINALKQRMRIAPVGKVLTGA
jgi:hypothetical protein